MTQFLPEPAAGRNLVVNLPSSIALRGFETRAG